MDSASVHSKTPSSSAGPKQEKEPEQENPDLLAVLDGVYGPVRNPNGTEELSFPSLAACVSW